MIYIKRKYKKGYIEIKQCNCPIHKDGKKMRMYFKGIYLGKFKHLALGLMAADNLT